LSLLFAATLQGMHEKRLIRKLFKDYDKIERPAQNDSHPVRVDFGLTLQQIIDVVRMKIVVSVVVFLIIMLFD
jgi:hypothetical protein